MCLINDFRIKVQNYFEHGMATSDPPVLNILVKNVNYEGSSYASSSESLESKEQISFCEKKFLDLEDSSSETMVSRK